MATSPLQTQSGPAYIEIYKYPTVEVNGVDVPNYSECFTSAPGDPTKAFDDIENATPNIVLKKENQFQDCKITISRDQFEHKTQASSKASRYIITGIELMLEVSIANITTTFFEEVFSTTALTGTGTPADKAIWVKDNAGQELEGCLIRVKPYLGASVGTDIGSFINLLAATPVDINNTDLTYALETQRQLKINYYALPFYPFDPSGATEFVASSLDGTRVIFGGLPNEAVGIVPVEEETTPNPT